VISRQFSGGPEKNQEKPQFRIAGVTAEVQTELLPNGSLVLYLYISVLGSGGFQTFL
jgi:hypothetical protein